eukprot:CAMPEP_0114548586 /NCGR_PEP_ID=MMETSP0114-20121206/5063_1 /TAXON_ID=31324 /ORGANISM="Goniomonas sp, Strain m" /LENGTH=334 /DNA_ID=CAMNT_0001733191 /DNA_START=201 /DNA_END=1205 /DNA_ORIENTATION=-
MFLCVHVADSESFEVRCSPTDTVRKLKFVIEDSLGVPVDTQQLAHNFGGNEWEDNEILSRIGLHGGASVYLSWPTLRIHTSPGFTPGPDSHVGELFVFDLDDTLTTDGVMQSGTRACLQKLHAAGHRLAIASFNLSAVEFLRQNNVVDLFEIIVCGFHATIRKSEHVREVLAKVNWPRLGTPGRGQVYFFDDQPGNIEDVREAFPGTVCLQVHSIAILPLYVQNILDQVPARQSNNNSAPSPDRLASAASTPAGSPARQYSEAPRPPPMVSKWTPPLDSSTPSQSWQWQQTAQVVSFSKPLLDSPSHPPRPPPPTSSSAWQPQNLTYWTAAMTI